MLNKKKINLIVNIIIGIIVAVILIPRFVNNLRKEGIVVQGKHYLNLVTKEEVFFPFENGYCVVVFWASWCAPCKLEMGRLRNSVIENKIPRNRIFAINPFENLAAIDEFLKKDPYPFIFIHNPELAVQLEIEATPTVVTIDNSKVSNISSGISLLGIWLLESKF